MTVQEALTQYAANTDYDGNPAKQLLALQALRVICVLRPNVSAAGGSLNWPSLDAEKAMLEKMVGANTRTSLTPLRARYM